MLKFILPRNYFSKIEEELKKWFFCVAVVIKNQFGMQEA
jgi:hypothetical protein